MVKKTEAFEDLSDLQIAQKKHGWKLLVLSLMTLFFFLPVSVLLGWAKFFSGPRLLSPGLGPTILFYLPAYLGAIYFMLLAPFLQIRFLRSYERPLRFIGVFLLWGLPLFSFSYYLGDFKNSLHAYEVGWLLVAALGMPLVLFWRTGNSAVLLLGIGLGTFIPFFVVEDILGPFSPLYVYASQGPWMAFLRTGCVVGSLWIALFATVPVVGRKKESLPLLRLGLVGLAGLSMAIVAGEWAWPNQVAGARLFSPDLNWLGYLVLVYFLRRTDSFGKKAYWAASFSVAVSLAAQAVALILDQDSGHWGQIRFFNALLGLVLIGLELKRRFHKDAQFTQRRSGTSHTRNSPSEMLDDCPRVPAT